MLHIILAFASWFVFVVAPAARLAYEDRDLPKERRRGVSILPAWPLLPLIILVPIYFLGFRHPLALIVAAGHVVLLAASLGYIALWTARLHRRE